MTVIAKTLGYSLSEIDELDIGYLMDLLITQSNASGKSSETKKKKPKIRKATQADFDAM